MLLQSSFRFFCSLVLALSLAFTLPGAQALANNDDAVIYEVKRGDTLFVLAKKYMRSYRSMVQVQRLNKIRNPRRLPIGKQLRIPRSALRFTPLRLNIAHRSGSVAIANKPLNSGTTLSEGDVITTQGNGYISFATTTGKQFTMPSNSVMFLKTARRYVLDNIEDIDFVVRKGRGRTKSTPLKRSDRLRMSTPVATTAVRGTEFRTAFSDETEASITEVVEGSVNVAVGEDAGVTEAGFGLVSTQAGLGEKEALLPPVALIEPGKVQTGETLDFTISRLANAERYRVQIALDAGFYEVFDEAVTSDLSVSFPSLDDQRYYVRARGISSSGVEGISSKSESFLRKRLSVKGEADRSPFLDGFQFKWGAQGEGTSTYAFQLWRKGEAASPIVDETGLIQTSIVVTDLAPGDYEWRVAVMQSDVEEGLIKVWGPSTELGVSD